MLTYEEAIKQWGYKYLKQRSSSTAEFDRDSIKVEFGLDEGNPCCGGTDPYCYCSFAESPYSYISIQGYRTDLKTPRLVTETDRYTEFDTVMRELYEIGRG